MLSTQIKKRQQRIRTVLEAQKLPFDVIDVAQDDVALEKMRELVGNEEALAPQIANGDEYCGVCKKVFLISQTELIRPFLAIRYTSAK